jgi:threonine dehydratase
MQRLVSLIVTVSDAEALSAVRSLWEDSKLVVEPGGAVAVAALQSGKLDVEELLDGGLEGKNVCLLVSGGNIDEKTFLQALQHRQQSTTMTTVTT